MDEQDRNAKGGEIEEVNEGNLLTGPQTRREFLLKGMTLAAALPLVLAVDTFSRTASAKAPKIHWVNPNSAMAKNLKYVVHADRKPKSYWAAFDKTKNIPGDRHLLCWECTYYSATEDATKSKHATCSILSGVVNYDDVCMMWNQNPRYKGKKHV